MTARWVERWTKGRVTIEPWQAQPPAMQEAGLTPSQTSAVVWILTPSGKVAGGAAAVNEALKYTWWGRPLAWFYPLPLIRPLQDAIYRWVARNRHRFPGVTPACETTFNCVE